MQMASGMQAGASELRISDLQGAVQKESPDVYVTFRLGNEHAETPVRSGAAYGLGLVVDGPLLTAPCRTNSVPQ